MKKAKNYQLVRFPTKTFLNAAKSIAIDGALISLKIIELSCKLQNEEWNYDSIDEFLADYIKFPSSGYFWVRSENVNLYYNFYVNYCSLSVTANTRSQIESTFHYFESDLQESKIPDDLQETELGRVFIGHGRSKDWRDLKDHLQDQHSYLIESYESGARAGHTIRDILEQMVESSSFAILVLTSEDEQTDGQFRARQNVIHEAGLFQGKLGFSKAIMIAEENVEIPSNLDGIQFIRFEKGRIKETFGDVLATLKRELC